MPGRGDTKKLLEVASKGQHATENQTPDNFCINCFRKSKKVISCGKCQCGRYCSENCLRDHMNHKDYCDVICSLEKLEANKRMKNNICVSDSEKLPLKLKIKLIQLVGRETISEYFLE